MSEIGKRKPGWDGPMISKIANRDFGGYPGFFKSHGWSETGSQMMPKVQRRVKESYGSVENFFLDSLPADPFETQTSSLPHFGILRLKLGDAWVFRKLAAEIRF